MPDWGTGYAAEIDQAVIPRAILTKDIKAIYGI